MKYRLHYKNGREAVIDSSEGIYTDSDAAGYLIKLTLQSHSSVVVFAKKPDFYTNDMEVRWVASFDAKQLRKETSFPWIEGLPRIAVRAMQDVFSDMGLGRDLVHLKGLKKTMQFARPSMAQAFYQICDRGSKSERITAESLFTGLLKETAYREPMREVAFFFEAPYRPFTRTAITAIKEADDAGCALIGIYRGDGIGRYGISLKNGRLYLTEGKKTRECRI